jgi:hypothetical protein
VSAECRHTEDVESEMNGLGFLFRNDNDEDAGEASEGVPLLIGRADRHSMVRSISYSRLHGFSRSLRTGAFWAR